MIPYIFHVSLLLALCYLLYRLLWEKETYFQLNRWILITCLLLSFGLPWLTIPEGWSLQNRVVQQEILAEDVQYIPKSEPIASEEELESAVELSTIQEAESTEKTYPKTAGEATVEKADESTITTDNQTDRIGFNLNFWQIIQYIYFGGLAIFVLNFLIQLLLIIFQRKTNPTLQDGRYTIVEMNQDKAPFSFGNSIFINPTKYDWDTYNQILEHEKIHIEQRHTIDILIAELVVIALWFNPFAWLYRKAVENNLEYLTDYNMLHRGTEIETYQLNLLRVSVPQLPLNLTTNYNQSFLKKRIAMMNVKKSSAGSSWKYLLLLPLLALTVITLNPIQLQSQTEPTKKEKIKKTKLPTPPSPPASPTPPSPPAVSTPPSPPSPPSSSGIPAEPPAPPRPLVAPSPPSPPSPPVPGIHSGSSRTVIQESDNNGTTKTVMIGDWNINPADKTTVIGELYTEEEGEGGVHVSGSVSIEDDDHLVLHKGMIDIDGAAYNFATTGDWKGKFNGNQLCLRLSSDIRHKNYSFSLEVCDRDWPSYMRPDAKGPFKLPREAGILTLTGDFNGNRGDGTYAFEEDAGFRKFLDGAGYAYIDENLMLHLYVSEMGKSYFTYLDKEGYSKLPKKELEQLVYHRVREEHLKEYLKTFSKLDFDKPTMSELVQLTIHDIDAEYIEKMGSELFKELDINQIVEASIHDIDPEYIKEIGEMGYDDLDFKDYIEFAIHNIDPNYIKQLKATGLDLSQKEIVEAGIHNVDGDYIQELDDLGYDNLKFRDIIEFSIHNVDTDFIRDLKDSGFDLSQREIIEAAIHNIDIELIQAIKDAGFKNISFDDIVQFGVHGINANYIEDLDEAGLVDLDKADIIEARIHGVQVRDIADFKNLGLKGLDFEDIIQMRIHGIDPDYVEDFIALGYKDITVSQIKDARIHGINTDDVEAFHDLGYKNISMKQLNRLKIHGVTPSYIRRLQESGTYKDLSIEDLIEMKIKGIDKKTRRQR